MTQVDLGFLSDQRKTLVIALPSGAKSVVVRYDQVYRVSCVMPPATRRIRVDDEDVEIKCPDILFTTEYLEPPKYGSCPEDVVGTPSIYVLNTENKAQIEACPYLLPNVYHTGDICFGDIEYPFSPREAFNCFWESPFNADLLEEIFEFEELEIDEDEPIADFVRYYHSEGIKLQPWQNLTDVICGNKFWASPEGADAVLLTSERHLLSKIPKKFWRMDPNGYPMLIALGNKQKGYWEFASGGFKFKLDEGFVTTHPQYSADVAALKAKFTLI